MPTRPPSLTTAGLLLGALLGLAGCGSSDSGNDAVTTSANEANAATAASGALGAATDLGTNQLLGPPLVAELDRRLVAGDAPMGGQDRSSISSGFADGGRVSDAPRSPLGLEALSEGYQPHAQGTVVVPRTASPTTGYTFSGSFTFTSDQLAPDGSSIGDVTSAGSVTGGWWHCQLSFAGQLSPFTVTDDDGNTASITGGEIDLYVENVFTPGSVSTSWHRDLDVYSTIPPGNPVTTKVTLANNGKVFTIVSSGIRHVRSGIDRQVLAGLITRTQADTIDGDASLLLSSIPSVGTMLAVTSGPSLALPGGAMALFTNWQHQTTLADGVTRLPFIWNRHATHTITMTRPDTSSPWTFQAPTNFTEAIYITRDGHREGPFDLAGLLGRFGLHLNLLRLAAVL